MPCVGRFRSHPALVELRTLGGLAAPIVVTQLSQMSMGVADVVMAGRVSATDVAGVALGGNFYFPVMLLMSGIIMAVTPSVSQLHGAGRVAEAGAVVRQALWIAVVGGVALTLLLYNAEPIYRWFKVDEQAIPVAVSYLRATSLGLAPLLAYAALRCLCEGMSWTRAAMYISFGALAIKLPLNWLFIYGSPALGVPAMGGAGCGVATAIVMVATLLAMIVTVSRSRVRAAHVFAAFSLPEAREIVRLLKLGLPIGLALFAEVAFFSFATLLIGRLGVEVVASHQTAFNIIGVAFMVPLALGMAATIRVGFNVGAGKRSAARMSAWLTVATTALWGVLIATLLMLLRHHLVDFYSDELEVIRVAAGLLVLGALFQVFDGTQVAMMGALRGYKDTRAPMLIALMAYWLVGLPVGYTLCFGFDFGAALGLAGSSASLRIEGVGVRGLWWGLVAGLGVAAAALFARLRWVSSAPAPR